VGQRLAIVAAGRAIFIGSERTAARLDADIVDITGVSSIADIVNVARRFAYRGITQGVAMCRITLRRVDRSIHGGSVAATVANFNGGLPTAADGNRGPEDHDTHPRQL
jgi:hypothetical protein